MGVLGSPQNQLFSGEHVNKAGIAFHQTHGKVEHPVERLVEPIGAGDAVDSVVQNSNM
jgi:hypothetical protein